MTQFAFNPSDVSTGIEVLPADRYEVIIREPKVYNNPSNDPAKQGREGISFMLTVAEGEYKGKPMLFRPNFNDDFGPGQAKSLAMAAYGYTRKQEKDFNANESDKDWSVDTGENGSLGSAWVEMKDRRVFVTVAVNVAKDGSGAEFQKFVGFEPME